MKTIVLQVLTAVTFAGLMWTFPPAHSAEVTSAAGSAGGGDDFKQPPVAAATDCGEKRPTSQVRRAAKKPEERNVVTQTVYCAPPTLATNDCKGETPSHECTEQKKQPEEKKPEKGGDDPSRARKDGEQPSGPGLTAIPPVPAAIDVEVSKEHLKLSIRALDKWTLSISVVGIIAILVLIAYFFPKNGKRLGPSLSV
jgi:hypothetical protein